MKKEIINEKQEKEEDKKVEKLPKEKNIIKEGGNMKKQIITLCIGILIGAVITAAIFLIARPKGGRNIPNFQQFERTGERVRPGTGNDDFSKRNRDNSKKTDDSKVDEDNKTEESTDEKQG